MEELPVIAGFVADSLTADLTTFSDFSPMFDEAYVTSIRTKRAYCLELESSDITIQKLKKVTAALVERESGLRSVLNKVEAYVKLAGSSLDVSTDSFGLKTLRDAISRGNDEGVIAGLQTLLKNINRNLSALQAKGLAQTTVDELSAAMTDIDTMNNEQNMLANTRNQNTASNIADYNALWDLLSPVLETGRSLFRGVDDVKLKEYTMSALVKRVNASGSKSTDATGTQSNDMPAS